MPVYFVTVFGKGEKSTLTASECAALKKLTKQIVEEHQKRITVIKRDVGKTA